MPFKIKDVLIVDATVIIGLLILLTFQSISSSFIQNESSDFMNEWYDVQNQYTATLGLLEDWNCIGDKTAWEREFGDVVIPNVYNYDHVSKEMEGEIKKNCSKWLVESLEQERYLMELDDWGYSFNYLHQIDEDGMKKVGVHIVLDKKEQLNQPNFMTTLTKIIEISEKTAQFLYKSF